MKTLGILIGVPLLLLGFLLLPSCRSTHGYVNGNSAVQGNRLYLVEYKSAYVRQGLPIPDRPPERHVSEARRIASVDLADPSPVVPLGEFADVAADSVYSPPGLIYFDAGAPRLVGYAERDARIRSVVPLACEAEVRKDAQDFRLLYYFCDRQRTLYRFEAPFERATMVTLPEGSSLTEGFDYSQSFRSVVGDPYLYVWSGRPAQIHRVDLGGVAPSMLLDLPAGDIIGITTQLRVQQVVHSGSRLEVAVFEQGQPQKRWVIEDALLGDDIAGRHFFAPNGFAAWHLDVLGDRMITLNVRSGAFARIVIPSQ